MSQSKIIRKRIKVKVKELVDEEDRISALPDVLLLEILARLPCTKIAIRTGTLSKRWKYLWTSVPTLIFQDYDFDLPPSEFASLVDKTLTQCRQSKLRKFAAHTRYDIQFESQVKSWIRYALSCNVEELDLNLNLNHYNLPSKSDLLNEDFFIDSNFTDLKLPYYLFNPKGAIKWKSLRSLYISRGELDVDAIKNILSGCPVLETLVFSGSSGLLQFGITTNGIKKLEFSIYKHFHGEFKTQVNNVIRYAISSDVEELDMDFHIESDSEYKAEFALSEYFSINSCFTDLRLQGCKLDPNGAISWKRLRSLCIKDGNLDEDAIENILFGSPLLESLELEDCYGYKQLDITSKSVKKLVFSRYRVSAVQCEIASVINAANILSLTIKGDLYLLNLLPSPMPSLVEVNLDFTMHELPYMAYMDTLEDMDLLAEEIRLVEEKRLKGFIRSFCHVKELKIGNYYGEGTYKQSMLEEYRRAMLKEYKKTLLDSMFEEVRQLKEKIQKMEHEKAERDAEQVMQEIEREQLKEKIRKLEHERTKQEAKWVAREEERVKQEMEREAQRESKVKEMQDKMKAFEEVLLSRFSCPPSS